MNAMVQSLKDFGTAKLAAMAGVGILLLGFFIFLISSNVTAPSFTTLYSDLTLEDSNRIIADLEASNIPYELRAGGTQIMAPADEIMRLRIKMAGQGLPSEGSVVGYEVFDRSETLGTSNFLNNVNYLRALEGELGRTISAFSGIESARVHLVIPKRELFTRDRLPPTASVAVTMVGSKKLGKTEIASIRHLVATAVPGLQTSKITIVDNKGRLLAKGATGDEDEAGAVAAEAEEFRVGHEKRLKSVIEDLLSETVGLGKVRAEVSAEVDFDRIETTAEIYDPDGQVPRSVQTVEEREDMSENGGSSNVSVANNLPDAQNSDAGNGSTSATQRLDETTNFEISKTIKRHVQEVGKIERLSVAVLVDGTYTTDEEGNRIYQPRSPEELEQYAKIVRSAIGYDETRGDRVEVANMQFVSFSDAPPEESMLDLLKRDMNSILETVIFGIVAILGILLIVRPLINHVLETNIAARDEEQMALTGPDGTIVGQLTDQTGAGGVPMTGEGGFAGEGEEEEEEMINLAMVKGQVKSSSIKRITELIDEHPDETMGVIRQWMMSD